MLLTVQLLRNEVSEWRESKRKNLGHFTSAPGLWGWAMSHVGAAINAGELDTRNSES